jgi:hypothetical protein
MTAENTTTILVNLKKALEAADGSFEDPMSRYNGGWTKTITALDESKDNGYSLVGEFVCKETVTANQAVGLYLDCDLGGSRKNQVKYYTLFELKPDGAVTVLETLSERAGRTSDWAIQLRPAVKAWFEARRGAEAQRAELEARIGRLRGELAEAESELAGLGEVA